MASKSSSDSSTSQNQDGNSQNQLPNSNLKKSIDFGNPSKDDSVRGSKMQEHNFFSSVQVGSSSFSNKNNEGKDEDNNEKKSSDSKYYSCNFCKGQYSSLQALGGHQNAHKAERALKKQQLKQKYEGSTPSNLGQPHFNPYLNYPITPPFASYNYRPLGVRIESMIHKSPYINSPRIGHGALPLHDVLHPSLVALRNNIEGSNSRVPSLGIGGATTSRIGAILKLGESSANNVAPNIEEEVSDSESSGLDLSLKL